MVQQRVKLAFLSTLLIIVVAGLCFGLAQLRKPGIILKHSEQPSIILISVDTLRADHFSPKFMPRLYEWAEENCLIYTNAYANSTWTKPSHLTMFTGMLPKEHNVSFMDSEIPDGIVTLAQKMKSKGYKTYAFISGGQIAKEFGFDRGFDYFWQLEWKLGRIFVDDGISFDKAQEFVEENGPFAEPFFLFAHTYMIHQYWMRYSGIGLADDRDPAFQRFRNESSLETKRQLYADTVKDCDAKLMSFVSFLQRHFPDSFIIITSDHGEGLGEKYGKYVSLCHAGKPYPDQIRVPLIVFGLRKEKSNKLVGIDDIAGTILELADIDNPSKKSLFRKKEHVVSENVITDRAKFDGMRHVAITKPSGEYEMTSFPDASAAEGPKGNMSEHMKKQLEALGYIQK